MAFESVLVVRSYEQVVEQIRDGIRDGRLRPGHKLPPEKELAESFGVSRGVVREAIKTLAALGQVESRQGSGTFVRTPSAPSISRDLTLFATTDERSVLGLAELRESLDVAAARLAAERRTVAQAAAIVTSAEATAVAAADDDIAAFSAADDRFHQLLAEAADNPYLAEVLGSVRTLMSGVAALIVSLPGSMVEAATQHRRVAEDVAAGDAENAASAMAIHVRYAAEALRSVVGDRERHPKPAPPR